MLHTESPHQGIYAPLSQVMTDSDTDSEEEIHNLSKHRKQQQQLQQKQHQQNKRLGNRNPPNTLALTHQQQLTPQQLQYKRQLQLERQQHRQRQLVQQQQEHYQRQQQYHQKLQSSSGAGKSFYFIFEGSPDSENTRFN